jgi:hypothetical protein
MAGHRESTAGAAAAERFSADGVRFVRVDHAEDAVLAGMLGAELLEAMVAVKRREIERFNLAVTDWEWREYATHA